MARAGRRAMCRVCSAAVAALTAVAATDSRANTWNNILGGSFQDPGNWLGGVPTATNSATFNLSAANPYTVTFAADALTSTLFVGNDTPLFDLGGHTYSFGSSDSAKLGYISVQTGDIY